MISNFTLASKKIISLQTFNVPHASVNDDKKVFCHHHHCYSQLNHIERIGHKDLHTKPVFKKNVKDFLIDKSLFFHNSLDNSPPNSSFLLLAIFFNVHIRQLSDNIPKNIIDELCSCS
jgi:hypothetical protein